MFWPGKLEKQLDSTAEVLNEIEEQLKKNQLKDVNDFEDKLESMQMAVAGFAAFNDPQKAHEGKFFYLIKLTSKKILQKSDEY